MYYKHAYMHKHTCRRSPQGSQAHRPALPQACRRCNLALAVGDPPVSPLWLGRAGEAGVSLPYLFSPRTVTKEQGRSPLACSPPSAAPTPRSPPGKDTQPTAGSHHDHGAEEGSRGPQAQRRRGPDVLRLQIPAAARPAAAGPGHRGHRGGLPHGQHQPVPAGQGHPILGWDHCKHPGGGGTLHSVNTNPGLACTPPGLSLTRLAPDFPGIPGLACAPGWMEPGAS